MYTGGCQSRAGSRPFSYLIRPVYPGARRGTIPIHVLTFGGPRVLVEGSERPDLLNRARPCSLLAYLAVERSGTRDGLGGLLWPESPPRKARHSLNQALHELRKELGDDWLDGSRESLQATPQLACDAVAFAEAVDEGRYREALDLFGGPFLAGIVPQHADFEGWVERQRLRLERLRRKAFRELVSEEGARGARTEALELARTWVDADPLDDEANHALIDLLAQAGRRADALRHYDRFAEALAREMELTPVDETKALIARIREAPEAPVQPRAAPALAPEPPPPPSPQNQEVLQERFHDNFKILRLIGEGSTSTVHLAREPALRRLVALKVLRADLAGHDGALRRFEREAHALAGLSHPNILPIYRVGLLSRGLPYLVLPFVRGVTLADRVRAVGRLPVPEVRRLLRDVASALSSVHRLRLVHRDLRPENLLYEEDTGRIWLMDFGVAALVESGEGDERLTRTGEQLGQPGYISPEQIMGSEVTAKTDVYSFGVLGIALLSGEQPRLPGALPSNMIAKAHQRDAPLAELLTPCLAENPRHRPAAPELGQRIAALDSGGEATTEKNIFTGLQERRIPWIVAASVAFGLTAIGLVDQLVQNGLLPGVAFPVGLVTVLAGLATTVVLSWYHGRPGPQPVRATEVTVLVVIAVGWALACLTILTR